ncbi:hypothetical protein BB987_08970 [Photorhabdus temperata]|uniref:DUF2594 family protein n=2 Tax=Photorhabdus khanii TaxID=1004150 RepID=W3V5D5_9GAMM|nr:DUF2594 family protein [Photorhabdus khanii]ETS31032.1 Protein of unknown function (DUF2594) [Photorhabdus khanii NC19]MQL47501.1 DUF2594 family protein [Photorhabdus khanii]OHV54847.1 hypothetical protein BB987_08970 [Photorhabdus temperata]
MSKIDLTSSSDTEVLATEVTCLKMLLALVLKTMGQANAGKVILNVERAIAEMEDKKQAKVFENTVQQIKALYRQ